MSQKWFLRQSSRGAASTRPEAGSESLCHNPQADAKIPGTQPGAPCPDRFHCLSRNVSTLGPRNHLSSLERRGLDSARAGPSHTARQCAPDPLLPAPKLLHVPDQANKEISSQEHMRAQPRGPWTLLSIPLWPSSAKNKDQPLPRSVLRLWLPCQLSASQELPQSLSVTPNL